MLFTLIEPFGPLSGEAWTSYLRWRGRPFARFDSIDGILRPALFRPVTAADWAQTIIPHYFSDLTYARKKQSDLGLGDLVGLDFETHDESHPDFLGFDLIDGHDHVSLLTNWGNDVDLINQALSPAALIPTLLQIRAIQEELVNHHGEDGHVIGCRIVSLYRVSPQATDRSVDPTELAIDFPRAGDFPRPVDV